MTDTPKHPGGRPLKFKSVEEMQKLIDSYFANTPEEEWMITGLAVALDTDRSILIDYEERDEFSNAIKKAKRMIENAYEKRGLKVGNAFDIFRLKNMGWRDQRQTDLTTNGKEVFTGAGYIGESTGKTNTSPDDGSTGQS